MPKNNPTFHHPHSGVFYDISTFFSQTHRAVHAARILVLLPLLFLLVALLPLSAQPGALDLSFAQTGTGLNGDARAFALQTDGKVIVGGVFTSYNGTGRGRVARLNTDGTLDASFAPTGTGLNSLALALAVQSDGKVLVGGDFTDYNGTARKYVARLNADGTLDASFALTGAGLNNAVWTLAVQSDGKVLVGGFFTSYNGTARNFIARLNADGTLDASFAPTGTGLNSSVLALAVQSDGKVLVGGFFRSYNSTERKYVARLNADGTLDASFAPTGAGLNSSVRALAVQSDGKVLVGGDFTDYNGTARKYVARLNADGTLDASFAPTGAGLNSSVDDLAVQSDGKVLVGGDFTDYNGTARSRVAQLNSDGTLDASFAQTERGLNSSVFALAVQSDGKALVGGDFTDYNGTLRNYVVRLMGVQPPPTVTGFTPTTARVGDTLVVTGTNLTGASEVSVGGALSSVFTVLSSTLIRVIVPAGAASGAVRVTTPGGVATAAQSFTLTLNISLTVQPSPLNFGSVVVGASSLPQKLTITGRNIPLSTDGKTRVIFPDIPNFEISDNAANGTWKNISSQLASGQNFFGMDSPQRDFDFTPQLRFTPRAPGTIDTTITLQCNGQTASLRLQATATAAQLPSGQFSNGVTVSPYPCTPSDSITMTVDITKIYPTLSDNQDISLNGATDIWLYSGYTPIDGQRWQNIIAPWRSDATPLRCKLVQDSQNRNLYTLKMRPNNFYPVRQGQPISELCFVFNDGPNNNREGKAIGWGDFFVPLVNLIPDSTRLSLGVFVKSTSSPVISRYKLTGRNLLNGVTITPPQGVQLSPTQNGSWTSSPLRFSPRNGQIDTTIYVRLDTMVVKTVIDSITHESGAVKVTVAVTGEVKNPDPILEIRPTNGLDFGDVRTDRNKWLSYKILGNYLRDNVTIQVPAQNFSVFGDTTSTRPIQTILQKNGNIDTTLWIRFAPNTTGMKNDPIVHISGNITRVLVVSGKGIEPPVPVLSLADAITEINFGLSSRDTTYRLSATDLRNDVTISAPPGFNLIWNNQLSGQTITIPSSSFTTPQTITLRPPRNTAPVGGYVCQQSQGATQRCFTVTAGRRTLKLPSANTVLRLSIAPQPATDKMLIQFSTSEAGNVELFLYDALGRLVEKRSEGWFAAGEYQIEQEVSRLPSGIYTVVMQNGIGIERTIVQIFH